MKYCHSQAFKIHKALPESRYIFNIDMEDQLPEKDEDIYRVEVSQKNGQWAYSSPIFVRNIYFPVYRRWNELPTGSDNQLLFECNCR